MTDSSFPIVMAYFECFSGASGDMLVGALLDAGLPFDLLRKELERLPIDGYTVRVDRQKRAGIMGTKFSVDVTLADQPHRHLADIEELILRSDLPAIDMERGLAIFRRLARAEAKVHGTTPDHVHFHEVGAVDSIIDIMGFVIGLRLLNVTRIYSSPMALGSGFVESAHGQLPVPAPATLEILAEAGAPAYASEVQAELLTPTGAAILCELAHFERPTMRPRAIGYGWGSRTLPQLNAVRLWLGESDESTNRLPNDQVIELACNIDDMPGEQLGFAMDRLLEAGALDVWFTPIHMKKNRPGVMLSALVRPADADRLSRLILTETSTLGVRYHDWNRIVAGRQTVEMPTPWGPVRAKVKMLDGQIASIAPEYEDCVRRAREAGVPLARVYQTVIAQQPDPIPKEE